MEFFDENYLNRKPRKEVIKHSAAIQISNSINLLQRRAWNILLAYAYNKLMDNDEHEISVSELMKVLELGKSGNEQHLKATLEGLVSTAVSWNLLNKDGVEEWGVAALLAEVSMKDGKVKYAYGPAFKERLFNPTMYARISLSMQNKFKSKHALALYELCVDYFNFRENYGETPFIHIPLFKKMMGLGETDYPEFKTLNKKVIKAPVEEINEISDLKLLVRYKKDGRKIGAVKFCIQKKTKSQLLLFSNDSETLGNVVETSVVNTASVEVQTLVSLLRKKTPSLKALIGEALKKSDFNYVRSNIVYANDNASKNYTNFLRNSLKKDWAREMREEIASDALKLKEKAGREITQYIGNLSDEHHSSGLEERFNQQSETQKEFWLKSAREKILASKHGEFLQRADNEKLLETAIENEAVKKMVADLGE